MEKNTENQNQAQLDRKQMFIHAGRIALVVAVLLLVVYFISVIAFSSSFFEESSEKNSLVYFDEDMGKISLLVDMHYGNLFDVAEKVKYAESRDEISAELQKYIGVDQFGNLRFTSGGKNYDVYGAEVVEEADAMVELLAHLDERGCTDVYYDAMVKKECIAFYVPVKGNANVDGIISVLEARNIVKINDGINEKALAVAIVNEDGQIYADKLSDDFVSEFGDSTINLRGHYYDFIHNVTGNKNTVDGVMDMIRSGEKKAEMISIFGKNYTVASAPIKNFDDKLTLVILSSSEGLIATEMTYIRHIVTILIIAILSLVVSLVFAMLLNKKRKEAMSTANLTDDSVGCANAEQFRRRTIDTVYKTSKNYAVVVFGIRQFNYLSESLGEEKVTEILRFISSVFGNFCDDNETYGYAGNGSFLFLCYAESERYLKDKIRLIGTLSNKYEGLESSGITLRFEVGVCFTNTKRRSVKELIDCATTASGYPKKDNKLPYSVYNEEIAAETARNEKIEAQMEEALANGDFKLFLQPKYNVKEDRIDSAEALVRWFDPSRGEYMFPGEFISLFETNGFISKLDHFIYLEVLKYMSHAAEHGDKIVPISVNVSRVTASAPDFLEFYIGNKHRYKIGDGFITIEFTESFAMEDYEKIAHIVEELHKNGMRCSIDDFGTGYSSFNILKNIPMDELKLDRFFLFGGINRERDDLVIEMVVNLAKNLGMTVVQEGVETKDMFDKLVGFGCDIIQGYYYAKAITLEEYKVFLKTNTSIKYKSVVK